MTERLDERTIGETNIDEIIDKTIRKTNVILDATILSTLMNCPRLTDFRFNHNFMSIGGKSNSLECGSIVHKFLEVYYGSIIKGVSRAQAEGFGFTAAELYITGCRHCTDFVPTHHEEFTTEDGKHICVSGKCILKPTCGHPPNEFIGVVNTPKEDQTTPYPRTGWHWVLDTCQQYLDFYRNDHWVPLEVEVVKGKVLYEDDEIRILWKSKLDWVVDTNQGIYPVDHKSMKQNRPNINLNNQFTGQCIIMETRNVFINKIGFQKTLPPEKKFLRPPINYTAARLMEWQSETLPFYAKLLLMYAESGHFPPNYTNCQGKFGNCAFIDICNADPGMREEELKLYFKVGPVWNPTNPTRDDDG